MHEAGVLPAFDFAEINAMRLATPYQAYTSLWATVSGGLHAAPKRAAELLDAHFNKPAPGKRCVGWGGEGCTGWRQGRAVSFECFVPTSLDLSPC